MTCKDLDGLSFTELLSLESRLKTVLLIVKVKKVSKPNLFLLLLESVKQFSNILFNFYRRSWKKMKGCSNR